MYEFVGDINDNKVPGLQPLFNYISCSCYFAENEGAVNQHNYGTTKKTAFKISQHIVQTT